MLKKTVSNLPQLRVTPPVFRRPFYALIWRAQKLKMQADCIESACSQTFPGRFTVDGSHGLRARRFFAVGAAPWLRIHAVPAVERGLRARRFAVARRGPSPRNLAGGGEKPVRPPKQSGAAVPRSLPRSRAVSYERSVRPMKRFCAAVLGSSPQNPGVPGSCGAPLIFLRRSRRSGAGCGVPQIPLWQTASGFAMNERFRRQSWFAVVFLS